MRNTIKNRLGRIVKRADYRRIKRTGAVAVMPGLVLQAAFGNNKESSLGKRIGYTVSRKVGKAVIRNKARRRLKSVASDVLTKDGVKSLDYVVIGRAGTITRTYDQLVRDMQMAIDKIDKSGQLIKKKVKNG
ncbi:MAG: ribonuclease P protein component [Rhodospirillaceae bacterium]|nr:ribonuclease P protein component [Rhodospirillaceae bacterium]|tara:strand:+ start:1404 stop:1799 length:396 start_codon:yes stop_codon:yes gene_type:complete